MSEHPNAVIARKGYEAFSAGDTATLHGLFAPDAVWHVPGSNQVSGDKTGVEAVLEYFGQLFTLSGGTVHVDLHDLLANDDHAVGLQTDAGSRDGATLNARAVLVFHLRDGKVTEVWEYFDDQPAVDAFYA